MYRILCAYSFSRAMYEYIMYKQNKFDDFGEHLGRDSQTKFYITMYASNVNNVRM